MQVDWVAHTIQGHPGQHARQPEAMITVHVGDADARDLRGRDPGVNHLALRPLAGIEKQALAIPAQHIAVVVTGPCGDLGGCAEGNELTHGTECPTAR